MQMNTNLFSRLFTLLFLCISFALESKIKKHISRDDIISFHKNKNKMHAFPSLTVAQNEQRSAQQVTEEKKTNAALSDSLASELHQKSNGSSIHDPTSVEEIQLQKEDSSPHPEEAEEELIEFNFENADLQNFIKQIENIFEITFLSDDAIDPLIKGARAIKGNKITFKTQKPLTRNQAWELFVTFMQITGLAIVKHSIDRTYRITTIESARKMPIPSFIGTTYTDLPDSDEMIRYVYFVENSNLETIKTIVDTIRSTSSSLIILQEQKAFILTERAYNVKKIMEIIKELDKTAIPQAMSLLQLKQVDAKVVKELYDSIIGSDDKNPANRFMNQRKQPTSTYFPENLKMIVDPRKNALVLIGPNDAIQKVEEFIKKYIDTELSQPYAAFFVYQLKYADAHTIADIMNNVTQFGKDTDAGKNGGIRGKDQYLKPLIFVPEKETNRLIIKGGFEDYMHAVEILEQLDAPPTQVMIEILIVGVTIRDNKSLGAQLRSKEGAQPFFGPHVKFQTSGLFQTSQIIENTSDTPGVNRLLGNLLQAIQGAASGNTIISLGSDIYNVFGVLQVFQRIANANTVANPFLTATNKTPAVVSLGQARRVVTSTVVGNQSTDSFGEQKAELRVQITPQINSDGMIVLDLDIQYDDFVNPTNVNDATKNVRQIKTSTVVADGEVLALGGLMRAQVSNDMRKVPFIGDIPGLGWLFKNRSKNKQEDNLLILLKTKAVNSHDVASVQQITQQHVDAYDVTLGQMMDAAANKDPIHTLFFKDHPHSAVIEAEDTFFGKKNMNTISKRRRISNKRAAYKTDTASSAHRSHSSPAEEKVDIPIAVPPIPADTTDHPHMIAQRYKRNRLNVLKNMLSAAQEKEHI